MSIIPVHFSGKTIAINTDEILNQVEANFVNERGDGMKGNLDMGGNEIRNVGNANFRDLTVAKINGHKVLDESLMQDYVNREIKDLKYILNNLFEVYEKKLKDGFKAELESLSETVKQVVEVNKKQENTISD